MATEIQFQLLQVSEAYENGALKSTYQQAGNIVFDKTTRTLTVCKSTSANENTIYAGGLKTASFSNGILTIVDWDEQQITVNLNNYATVTQLTNELKNYVTQTSLTTTLQSYATNDSVDTKVGAVKVAIDDTNAGGDYVSVNVTGDAAGRNFEMSVDDSTLTEKLNNIDGYTINNKQISTNPILTGEDIPLTSNLTNSSPISTVIQELKSSISGGTHFLGVTTTTIEDGSTTSTVSIDNSNITAKKGDIVIYNNLEFIWDGSKWVELGDSSANAEAITNLNNTKANKDDVYNKTESDGKFLAKNDIAPKIQAVNKQVGISVGGVGSTTIVIPYATTATNLESAPVISSDEHDDREIIITAGEKTSEPFTVKYAVKAAQDENGQNIANTFASILESLCWKQLD